MPEAINFVDGRWQKPPMPSTSDTKTKPMDTTEKKE
jgi:hypothetical protein